MTQLQNSIYHSLLVSLMRSNGPDSKEFRILDPEGNLLKKVKSTPAGACRTAVTTKGFIDMDKKEYGSIK